MSQLTTFTRTTLFSGLLALSASVLADGRYTSDIRSLGLGGNLSTNVQYHVVGGNPALLPQVSDPTDLLLRLGSYGRGEGSLQNYDEQLTAYQQAFDAYVSNPSADSQNTLEQASQAFAQSHYGEVQHAVGAIALPHLPIGLDAHLLIYHQEQFKGRRTGPADYSNPTQPVTSTVGEYRALTTIELATTFSGTVYRDDDRGQHLSIGMRPKLLSHRSRAYTFPAEYIIGIPFHSQRTGEFNLDLGMVYQFDYNNYLGLMAANLQPQSVKFLQTDASYRQQPDVRVGAAQKKGPWLMMAEMELLPSDNLWGESSRYVRVGMEVSPSRMLQVRLGSALDTLGEQAAQHSVGLGLNTSLVLLEAYVRKQRDVTQAGAGVAFKF